MNSPRLSSRGLAERDPSLESTAAADELAAERHDDGRWYYAGTSIAVPGAVDLSIAEVVGVREVWLGDEPQAILVSEDELAKHPELAWVPPAARRELRSGASVEFEVAWAVWQEHAASVVGVRAPERDGSGLARALARSEKDLRFARHEVDLAADRRARLVSIASALGMKRREVGELVGLTAGRVQQLIDELSPAGHHDVAGFLNTALLVLRSVGPNEIERSALPAPGDLVDEMIDLELLFERSDHVGVTTAGERAELHLRTKRTKESA
jgi:hypothetical protein